MSLGFGQGLLDKTRNLVTKDSNCLQTKQLIKKISRFHGEIFITMQQSALTDLRIKHKELKYILTDN